MTTGELRALAESIAREAGALLREAFHGPELRITAKSTPTDLVSEADHNAERLIRERLAAARPDDGVLGEEGGDRAGTSAVRWIVDPLDGTVNFLFGIPQWAVSIACEDETGMLVGVVYDPMRDELFSAERGGVPTLRRPPDHGVNQTRHGDGHGRDRFRLRLGGPPRAGRRSPRGCSRRCAICAASAPPRSTSHGRPAAAWTPTTSTV